MISISLFWVFFNESKPIIAEENIFNMSRIEQYFSTRSSLENDYVGAVNLLRKEIVLKWVYLCILALGNTLYGCF